MSAQDTSGPRRWNDATGACCAATRPGIAEVHREEMLGVLLATARPGQRARRARGRR